MFLNSTLLSCDRLHFAAGFFGVQQYQSSYHQVIAIEDSGFWSSLNPWEPCPNANNEISSLGSEASSNWTQIYLKDAASRLQKHIKGVEIDQSTAFAMQQLCSYETVALGYSVFCDLFTEEEWKGYEYANGKRSISYTFCQWDVNVLARSRFLVRKWSWKPCGCGARTWIRPGAPCTSDPNSAHQLHCDAGQPNS